ncbi:MAG TPA: MarR family transcriptional regulator [Solirubrobacterales bacterium]|nr:MarR family transcriptional regulator [Solirubrobacterales bacterium]
MGLKEGDELDEEGLKALGLAFKRADRNLRKLRGRDSHLPGGQIGHSRFELLDVLSETEASSTGELALAAGFTAPSISRMIEALVGDGFVRRVRSDSDRRVVMVALTDEGRRIVESRRAFWTERWQAALGDVDPRGLAIATDVMRRIAAVFEDPDRPVAPG